MLQVTDVRETRVFQEALEEGREEGREQAILDVAMRMLRLGRPVAEVADATGLSAVKVRAVKKRVKG